jgi:hydroxymethylpyrimidine pyrophosphatase-like HAD family hydrolase
VTLMVVSDLDGTLLDARVRLSPANRAALQRLGRAGVLRVVATGRSLYSARAVLDEAFPIDYLVFSSGVAVQPWPAGALLICHDMAARDAREASRVLAGLDKDFMVHHGAPDTHRFHHTALRAGNPDFRRRLARYEGFAEPWTGELPEGLRVSQLLAIEPAGVPTEVERVRAALPRLTVVRTTSPLDHRSTWIEIFPGHVSKSQTSDWLRRHCGLASRDVVAVGNDHNDDDLLAWADHAFVVANAVDDLKARHIVVASNDDDGFAEVAEHVLAEIGAQPESTR